MLDLQQIASFYPQPVRAFKKNLLREYLQYKTLDIIFASNVADRLSFMGGTAIRIVHGNSRFSEDLDFDNLGLTEEEFAALGERVQKSLSLEGYAVEMRNVFKDTFHCHLCVLNMLFENSIPPHKINHKANISALRELGVGKVIGINSVGSLRSKTKPGSIIIPKDYVDFGSVTFFDKEKKHIVPGLAKELREKLLKISRKEKI